MPYKQGVCVKRVEARKKVRAFFPLGQSKKGVFAYAWFGMDEIKKIRLPEILDFHLSYVAGILRQLSFFRFILWKNGPYQTINMPQIRLASGLP